MLRIRRLIYDQLRGVRTKRPTDANAPFPFYFKNKGWRECGPIYDQQWEWPDRFSGWSVIPPWFPNGKQEPSFTDDGASQQTSYPDPSTDRIVPVNDAMPELIVPPDLDEFKLKPYVSFRTPETEAQAPPLTAKDLFDVFYADRVTKWHKEGKYAQEKTDSLLEREVGDKESRRKSLSAKGLPVLDDGSSQ